MADAAANRKKWEKVRSRGQLDFIVRFGVLAWGIPSGVLFSIWKHWDQTSSVSWWEPIIIFAIVGIGFGATMWWRFEKIYQRQMGADGRED